MAEQVERWSNWGRTTGLWDMVDVNGVTEHVDFAEGTPVGTRREFAPDASPDGARFDPSDKAGSRPDNGRHGVGVRRPEPRARVAAVRRLA